MRPLALLTLLAAIACSRGEAPPAQNLGDPLRGRELIGQYGCTICHQIPGLDGNGSLGPSLQGVASRPSISFGTVQNTPANLIRFIQDPASLNPQSSMPPMALPPNDARDVVAFLGTLR